MRPPAKIHVGPHTTRTRRRTIASDQDIALARSTLATLRDYKPGTALERQQKATNIAQLEAFIARHDDSP